MGRSSPIGGSWFWCRADDAVHGRCGGALTRHVEQQLLDIAEADHRSGEVGERVATYGDEVECGAVRGGVDAERADDAQLLVDDVDGVEAG
jgi:hypothetical protein